MTGGVTAEVVLKQKRPQSLRGGGVKEGYQDSFAGHTVGGLDKLKEIGEECSLPQKNPK